MLFILFHIRSIFNNAWRGTLWYSAYPIHISMFNSATMISRWIRGFNSPKWALEYISFHPHVFRHWAHIPSRAFWDAAGPFMNRYCNDRWPEVLEQAGMNGNTEPFVHWRVQKIFQQKFYWNRRQTVLHPNVWAWLIKEGLCSNQAPRHSINSKNVVPREQLFIQGITASPVSLEWQTNLCVQSLRDYGLNQEQKTMIVVQAIQFFGERAWTAIEPQCTSYLRCVDLDVLRALCIPKNADNGPTTQMQRLVALMQDMHAPKDFYTAYKMVVDAKKYMLPENAQNIEHFPTDCSIF